MSKVKNISQLDHPHNLLDLQVDPQIPFNVMLSFNSMVKAILFLLAPAIVFSCTQATGPKEDDSEIKEMETLVKRRADGSISSVNQVDEEGKVHGIRATYYGDGVTLYSKQTFEHGIKNGPAIWYYTNGQVFKQSNFKEGKRQGLTRVYFRDGGLCAEYESDRGIVMPGLKEFNRDGTPVTIYPGVEFREIDYLATKNRIDLEISCTKKRSGVKFYLLNEENGTSERVYLITENDRAEMQFYLKPGEVLNRKIEIIAEIPTELGNVLAKKYSYQLSVSN